MKSLWVLASELIWAVLPSLFTQPSLHCPERSHSWEPFWSGAWARPSLILSTTGPDWSLPCTICVMARETHTPAQLNHAPCLCPQQVTLTTQKSQWKIGAMQWEWRQGICPLITTCDMNVQQLVYYLAWYTPHGTIQKLLGLSSILKCTAILSACCRIRPNFTPPHASQFKQEGCKG